MPRGHTTPKSMEVGKQYKVTQVQTGRMKVESIEPWILCHTDGATIGDTVKLVEFGKDHRNRRSVPVLEFSPQTNSTERKNTRKREECAIEDDKQSPKKVKKTTTTTKTSQEKPTEDPPKKVKKTTTTAKASHEKPTVQVPKEEPLVDEAAKREVQDLQTCYTLARGFYELLKSTRELK